jgi:CubicO group peptidase (beta-lactamase class C family)
MAQENSSLARYLAVTILGAMWMTSGWATGGKSEDHGGWYYSPGGAAKDGHAHGKSAKHRPPRPLPPRHRRDPRVREIRAIIDEILRAGRPHAIMEALAPPPEEPLTQPTAWLTLRGVVETLDEVLEEAPEPPASHDLAPRELQLVLGMARTRSQQALAHLLDPDPDFEAAMGRIEHAVRHLSEVDDGSLDVVSVILEELVSAARLLSEESIERAIVGGVDRATIEQAHVDLAVGAGLAEVGDYVGAIVAWEAIIGLGKIPVFSMNQFEQNIRDALAGQTLGYAYVINQNGLLNRAGQFGFARTGADLPLILQSPSKEINIASISKTVTAVAIMRLLTARGLSVDSSIAPWLPPSWQLGSGVVNLSFRDVMTHRSGLNMNNNGPYDYDSLRNYIFFGVNGPKTFTYQNTNFALFRVMLPSLWGINPVVFQFIPPEVWTAAVYIYYVRSQVLQPMGITANCNSSDPNPTLFYRFPYDNSQGVFAGNWFSICGSGGWYMSARELAAFLAFQRYDNGTLTPAARQLMDFNFLGWMDPANYSWGNGKFGVYRNHGGDLLYNPAPPPTRRGLDVCFMNFPFNVQVSLVINFSGGSYGGTNSYQCRVLQDAFDNAWSTP